MNIIDIYLQLLPLVLLSTAGFWLGRKEIINKEQISPLIYYIFAPILVLHNVLRTDLFNSPELLVLFGIFLGVTLIIYSTSWFFVKSRGKERSVAAFMISSTNCGYLGLPLLIALLGSQYEIYGIVCLLAYFLVESILGFGEYRIASYLKVPNLIALVVGGLLSELINFEPLLAQEFYINLINYNRYGFVIFGMLLLGVSLSGINIQPKLFNQTSKIILLRSLLWILLGAGLPFLLFKNSVISSEVFLTLALLSLTPISANTILVSTKKNIKADYIPISIVASTVFSLLTIPVLMQIIIFYVNN